MKAFSEKYQHWFIATAMLLLLYGMANDSSQREFYKIAGYFLPCFAIYIFCLLSPRQQAERQVRFWVFAAIVFRAALLFSFPNWSNDIYRFVWDGRLLAQGYNPFVHLPGWFLEQGPAVNGINRQLFESFGAKNTYSCYPPVAQAQFLSGAWLFPDDLAGSVAVMKVWLLLSEAGSLLLAMKLLKRLGQPVSRVLIYALNPLIIMEICGNVHFEGAMIFFLLLSLWWLHAWQSRERKGFMQPAGAVLAFALSVSSKLLPLMFLPMIMRHLGWKRGLAFAVLAGLVTLLLFLPFADLNFLHGLSDSLGLYFNKLEFNGSVYYLFRWLGYQLWGYNQIAILGPGLGLLAGLLIVWLAFSRRADVFFGKQAGDFSLLIEKMQLGIVLYLFCSTTVHPWYVALPLALSVFTSWRFPVLWSGLIAMTYINYSYDPYRENLWVVGVEYLAVSAYVVYEWWKRRQAGGVGADIGSTQKKL
ncbi:MAG: hypothetical protein RI973_2468 [Bacteroidota bacterium]